MAFEACPPDQADLFSIYIEDTEGDLHEPEDFGLVGQWDFETLREAHIVANWISVGMPTCHQPQ